MNCFIFITLLCIPPVFTPEQRTLIQSMANPTFELDTTNAYEQNEQAAKLGQQIFFDPQFSSNGEVSCATCHKPELYFTDGVAVSTGISAVTRNAPTVLNAAHQRWFFWDGRTDTLWGQPIQTFEHPAEMGGDRKDIATTMTSDPVYATLWEEVFGNTKNVPVSVTAANVAKCLAAYQTKLVALDSPFDRFALGDKNAMSESAQRGLQFFIGEGGCLRCHFGPWFTDGAFHTVGVGPLDGGALRDAGRFDAIAILQTAKFTAGSEESDDKLGTRAVISKHIARRREDWGAFRTPSLRNVAKTPPYMHAGQLASLEDVVEHYSTLENFVTADHHRETILVPLELDAQGKADLIAFLESLTGTLPPSHLLAPPK
ncbi:MAG: cytochrome-c peroxidase [Planctomycetes bacterium]|nr:cytochrome-c peroxidase [Planctomycetota bacterium]